MAATQYNPRSRLRAVQVFVVDTALTFTGLAALVGGIYSIFFKENIGLTATCVASGVALLFAGTIHRFEALKGFGVEAKVKKLDATIDKTEVALSQLREITEVASEAIIAISSKAGRWDSAPSVANAYDLSRKIKQILSGVGSSTSTINRILSPWASIQSGDLIHAALEPLRKSLQEKIDDMHKQISLLPPKEHLDNSPQLASLRHRQQIITKHLNEKILGAYKWPLDEKSRCLTSAVMDAPELEESTKNVMMQDLKPVLHHLDFLVANLDLEDVDFWEKRLSR